MREIELKLISELMKNSRRSDRDLGRAVGVSQPTVTRIRQRLERDGVIKEYTMIPDFTKLGYNLLSVIVSRVKPGSSPEIVQEARAAARRRVEKELLETIMLERVPSMGAATICVSFHKDYSSFLDFMKMSGEHDFIDMETLTSYLVNLKSQYRYRPLTLSTLAKHVLTMRDENKK